MSEPQTQADKDAIKAAMMATYAGKHAKIMAGKAAVEDLEDDASDYAKSIVKDHGLGPHGMMVGEQKTVVQFQKVNGKIRAHLLPIDQIKF